MKSTSAPARSKSRSPPPKTVSELFPGWPERTQIIGIVNLTPDSFSDGGRYLTPEAACQRAVELAEAGADAIDLGAESTRPGALEIDFEREWKRLEAPLGLIGEGRKSTPDFPKISVDTRRAKTAERALDAGVEIINDVSGGTYDPEILDVVAERRCLYIVTHSRGTPETMQGRVDYAGDFAEVVYRELQERLERALAQGIPRENLLLDPGIGFAKTPVQNFQLFALLKRLGPLHFPLLIGPSRKSFLRAVEVPEGFDFTEEILDLSTQAALTAGILAGARFVRIHEVKNLLAGIRLADQLRKVLAA